MGKKNKQFIVKLCHKYIQNINENIFFFQIYITLQYTFPFQNKGTNETTDSAVIKKTRIKTNAVILQILRTKWDAAIAHLYESKTWKQNRKTPIPKLWSC